jgi:aspartate aminotransferase
MARVFSGFPEVQLNLNVRGWPRSATLAINERCAALRREGRQVFRLGLGQSPFPVPEVVVEELRRNAHQKDYLPVQGLDRLREAVAVQHHHEFGVECSPADVIVGPGSKELMFLLQLVYYGDLVVPTPAWVSYAPQARIIGRHVSFVATERSNGWRLSPEQLDIVCRLDPGRPRIVVMNYPSNPTGASYTATELEDLADVASRNRVVILSDEIYGRLHHEGDHHSIVPLYPQGTIYSGGLSKWCGAGGWRLGLFVVPAQMRWLLEAIAVAASETFTSTSAPIQYAAVRAFTADATIEDYLERCRRVLRSLGRLLARRLREAGVEVLQPEGAFYLFPDFARLREPLAIRGIITSAELCERLLADTGVATLPGCDFGRPPTELTVRIAYVDFDGGEVLEAIAGQPTEEPLDAGFLKQHCEPTVTAVDRVCDWILQLSA